mmetsp:Transcript_56252/g.136369  ORF Transcript_56252/g.136369 Transcript_56252/m.136369 type:complete len:209 (-) Transcript_56252:715-1341(-)
MTCCASNILAAICLLLLGIFIEEEEEEVAFDSSFVVVAAASSLVAVVDDDVVAKNCGGRPNEAVVQVQTRHIRRTDSCPLNASRACNILKLSTTIAWPFLRVNRFATFDSSSIALSTSNNARLVRIFNSSSSLSTGNHNDKYGSSSRCCSSKLPSTFSFFFSCSLESPTIRLQHKRLLLSVLFVGNHRMTGTKLSAPSTNDPPSTRSV